jgi:hypothetical protein
MEEIGPNDFNYRINKVYSARRVHGDSANPTNTMNKTIIIAVLSSLIAVAAFLLSGRSPVNAESAIGYAAVLALLGVAALEYRINWKRLFGRS